MTAGALLLDLFPRIHVVNLPERADRRREMAAELARIGLALDTPGITLFPAVRPADKGSFPSIGSRGCFLSHLAILETIAAGPEPVGLIVEDDASITPGFAAGLRGMADVLRAGDWGLFYGFYPGTDPRSARIGAGLVDCVPEDALVTSHFMAVRRETAARIVPYFKAMLERPLGDPAGGPMHVDGAYNWFRLAHPEISRTLAADPPLSVQRPSVSDIQDRRWFDRDPRIAPVVSVLRRIKWRIRG
jgi:hypothetical protein